MDLLKEIERNFVSFPFIKECLLVFISVILGGIFAALINNGAMRKQSKFNLQYNILKQEYEKITDLRKNIEELEINLSFVDNSTEVFIEDIEKVNQMLLKTNESLKEKRKFVRKYLSAKSVEFSAQLIGSYIEMMYEHNKGLLDIKVVDLVDDRKIEQLRHLILDTVQLENEICESLEKLVSPGVISKIKRKCRKPLMLIEGVIAIVSVNRKKLKGERKFDREL